MIYYVTFERQGSEELVVQVNAKTKAKAKQKAMEAMLQCYDISVDTEEPDVDCLIVDENGEEI